MSHALLQRIVYRSMHLACRIQSAGLRSHSIIKLSKYTPVLDACTKRYASTADAATNTGDASIDAVIGAQITTAASTPVENATTVASNANLGETVTATVLDPIPGKNSSEIGNPG